MTRENSGSSAGTRAPGGHGYFWLALASAAWLSLEYVALGPYSWIYGYSAGLETIPIYLGLAKSGSNFSFWAPFIAGGLDRLSFWGNADPFNQEALLFAILPTWLANGLHVFLQRFIAIYFTARVSEDQLGMGRWQSALAGVLHGCFSYFTAGYMLAHAAVPLLIWGLARIQGLRRRALWALIAGLGFSTFTTFSQSVPYLFVFAIAWFALVLRERSTRFYLMAIVFFIALAIAESPQMVAILYNAQASQRAHWPLAEARFSLSDVFYYELEFDFFAQDRVLRFVSRAIPPVVVLAGAVIAWVQRRERRECRLFLRVALLYAALSLKVVFVLLQYLVAQALPWVKGINMIRFHTIPGSFMVAVTVTLGLIVIFPGFSRTRPPWQVASVVTWSCVGFLLLWPKVSLFYPLMIDNWGEKNYRVRALEVLRQADQSLFRVASVLDLQPAYAYAQGFETADGWANMYPRVYRELWLRVLNPLFSNLPRTRDILDPPGGRAQDHYIFLGLGLMTPDIGSMPGEDLPGALREGFDIERRFNLHLLSLLNVKYLLSEYPLRAPGLRLVHAPSFPSTSWQYRDYATGLVISPRPGHTQGSLWYRMRQVVADTREAITRKRRGKDVYIYENTWWLPRYRFARQVKVVESGKDVLDLLARMTSEELRDTALVEAGDDRHPELSQPLSPGSVSIELYTPDEILLSLENQGTGFLIIANTWNPFWRAEVDGRSRGLIRTNHAQFGLITKPGECHIRLYYYPPYAIRSWLRKSSIIRQP